MAALPVLHPQYWLIHKTDGTFVEYHIEGLCENRARDTQARGIGSLFFSAMRKRHGRKKRLRPVGVELSSDMLCMIMMEVVSIRIASAFDRRRLRSVMIATTNRLFALCIDETCLSCMASELKRLWFWSNAEIHRVVRPVDWVQRFELSFEGWSFISYCIVRSFLMWAGSYHDLSIWLSCKRSTNYVIASTAKCTALMVGFIVMGEGMHYVPLADFGSFVKGAGDDPFVLCPVLKQEKGFVRRMPHANNVSDLIERASMLFQQ